MSWETGLLGALSGAGKGLTEVNNQELEQARQARLLMFQVMQSDKQMQHDKSMVAERAAVERENWENEANPENKRIALAKQEAEANAKERLAQAEFRLQQAKTAAEQQRAQAEYQGAMLELEKLKLNKPIGQQIGEDGILYNMGANGSMTPATIDQPNTNSAAYMLQQQADEFNQMGRGDEGHPPVPGLLSKFNAPAGTDPAAIGSAQMRAEVNRSGKTSFKPKQEPTGLSDNREYQAAKAEVDAISNRLEALYKSFEGATMPEQQQFIRQQIEAEQANLDAAAARLQGGSTGVDDIVMPGAESSGGVATQPTTNTGSPPVALQQLFLNNPDTRPAEVKAGQALLEKAKGITDPKQMLPLISQSHQLGNPEITRTLSRQYSDLLKMRPGM